MDTAKAMSTPLAMHFVLLPLKKEGVMMNVSYTLAGVV